MTPLDLARLPTPLERLDRPSARLGVDIWVKRDDLTGLALSGNKVRKLAWLLADARSRGATTVITTGGIQSNHCRATAACAARLGLRCVLLLRGAPPQGAELDGNLLLDAVFGAEVRWCTPEGYRDRDAKMGAIAAELAAAGEVPYGVPEGGSNGLGAAAFAAAGQELADQAADAGVSFEAVLCGVGSGGTLAGLAMAGLDARVLGVAVCDDAATFRRRVGEIGAQAEAHGLTLPAWGPQTWDVLEGFQGPGYARTTPDALRAQVALARETGLLLDPVYTGKTWLALEALIARGALTGPVLFWHTGGAFGLFGRGGEIAAALGPGLAQQGVVAHGEG